MIVCDLCARDHVSRSAARLIKTAPCESDSVSSRVARLVDRPSGAARCGGMNGVILPLTMSFWTCPSDYYDLALLSLPFSFEGQLLVTAIGAPFRHRGTAIEPGSVGLSDEFSSDSARGARSRAFLRRSRFSEEAGGLPALVSEVRAFAHSGRISGCYG